VSRMVEVLHRGGETVRFAAGQVIFRAGEPGDLMYVVKSGKVDIVYGGELLDTVGAGGIIGEMALIGGESRSANAVARTDCALTPIDERRFEALVQEAPYFAVMVMRVLVTRLRQRNEVSLSRR
jgi:CRP/FNR family transcriptional regulator, cyclic AMP receptor protein